MKNGLICFYYVVHHTMPNNNCEVHTTMAGFGYPANGIVCTCIKPGDFSSFKDCEMLDTAYKAITLAEGWNFLKMYNTNSFMFGESPPQLERIDAKIHTLYPGHSGCSYGWTMRQMESIAKNGWDAYINGRAPKPLQAVHTLEDYVPRVAY